MNKSNVMNWIKKSTWPRKKEISTTKVEMDELYGFLEYKTRTETPENIYITTMVSREPRQFIGYVVSRRDKASGTIQQMVDAAPEEKQYCTDGYYGCLDTPCFGPGIDKSPAVRYNINPRRRATSQ